MSISQLSVRRPVLMSVVALVILLFSAHPTWACVNILTWITR